MPRRWIAGGEEVSTSKMGLGEGVKGYVEAQVYKTGLIITCMAGCYFYTGGWAAACLQQRLEEPFIRWSYDALPGALFTHWFAGVDAITDFLIMVIPSLQNKRPL